MKVIGMIGQIAAGSKNGRASRRALNTLYRIDEARLACTVAVSYTHLDVYKRQALRLREPADWLNFPHVIPNAVRDLLHLAVHRGSAVPARTPRFPVPDISRSKQKTAACATMTLTRFHHGCAFIRRSCPTLRENRP